METELILSEPLTLIEGDKIDKLVFKPLKAKHLRGLKGDPTLNDFFDIIGKLTGLTTNEVDELSAKDATAAIKVVQGFLGLGQ